ncbi:MAG TPA: hydroxymethylglutaryl-CoA synthase, partial [Acidimicrobiaceae bacterium]|nr:hydroxymethylglutaryl-CoA synthase [Acidimicrobiaceae bacterium]
SRTWEERFGEHAYGPLVDQAWAAALADAALSADDIDLAVVTGLHGRATRRAAGRLGVSVVDALADTVGNTGSAHPALLLAGALDVAGSDRVIALVVLADGCEVLLFRTTGSLAGGRPLLSVATQIDHRADVAYADYLSWRGLLEVQSPNRPEPNRPSS